MSKWLFLITYYFLVGHFEIKKLKQGQERAPNTSRAKSPEMNYFLKKWANTASFIVYIRYFYFLFSVFSNKHQFVKNSHPVNGAGIWTHNLRNMSLLQ